MKKLRDEKDFFFWFGFELFFFLQMTCVPLVHVGRCRSTLSDLKWKQFVASWQPRIWQTNNNKLSIHLNSTHTHTQSEESALGISERIGSFVST